METTVVSGHFNYYNNKKHNKMAESFKSIGAIGLHKMDKKQLIATVGIAGVILVAITIEAIVKCN